ncbi:BTAD domain-containing putative transcriptional regulator [Streptomyces sp. NPDC087897]|uniref:AfsR/SARP family transcriptional regulator n=1 Tax=Streptomyces sp. NPDC087897 TaxID=3365817 RepID=UPI0037FD12C6
MLGSVEVRRGGQRVALSGAKLHTVLAALLVAHEEVVPDERLCRLLWGWDPPATFSAQIYTYVSRLRKILGDDAAIVRRPPGYAMRVGDAKLDLREFERLSSDGRDALVAEEFEKAADLLRDALAQWNGQPFANASEYLADIEAPRLVEARAVALEHRIEADLALGRHRRITGELTGLVAEFPLRERIRCQLMTALCRSGRQADAIHLYHHGRAVLAEELGVSPGEELRAAYQALLDGTLDRRPPSAASAAAAPARPATPSGPAGPAAGTPAMLPPDTVDFTGRGPELELLCRALAPGRESTARPRRVLVTGMAGLGKTTLAVHAAHRCRRYFPDGQLYADLRSADGTPRHPARVLRRLLRALGCPAEGAADAEDLDRLTHVYRERTRGRQLLIVLDNASGASQLGALLPNSPEPAVLVTGRTALPTVAGAHTVALAPLAAGDAMRLLAAAAGPDRVAAAGGAAAAIVEHCAGLPLALRIAGTRIAARPLSPPDRLARRLADPRTRLRELHTGELDVHTSLLPSWRALEPEVRTVFPTLAALGPRPFPAADAATALELPEAAAERLLEALADAALLEVSGADEAGQPCYLFHPLVRLFALSLEEGARPLEEGARPLAAAPNITGG